MEAQIPNTETCQHGGTNTLISWLSDKDPQTTVTRRSQPSLLSAPEPKDPAGIWQGVQRAVSAPLWARCFLETELIPSPNSQLPMPFLKILQGTFEHLQRFVRHPSLGSAALNRLAFNSTSVLLLLEAALRLNNQLTARHHWLRGFNPQLGGFPTSYKPW